MQKSNNIVVFGSGDTAQVVIDIIEKESKYRIIGLIDRNDNKGIKIFGYEVLGDEDDLKKLIKEHHLIGGIIGVGDNFLRYRISSNIREKIPEFHFINAIHPNSIIAHNVLIGQGNIVIGGVVVNCNAKIGNFCFLNTNSSLDHDSIMQDYSSIAPGVTIGGNVIIKDFSSVSLGANVINDIVIGEHTVIGSGSTVLFDIKSYVVAYGTPCRVVRAREKGEKYF